MLLCNSDEFIPRLATVEQQRVRVVCKLKFCCWQPCRSRQDKLSALVGLLLYTEIAGPRLKLNLKCFTDLRDTRRPQCLRDIVAGVIANPCCGSSICLD